MSTTSSLIKTFKSVDDGIDRSVRYVTGVPHGTSNEETWYGPMAYRPSQDMPSAEKMAYAHMLSGRAPRLVVPIDEKDVQAVEDAAWKSKLLDFDRWVGDRYAPFTSPANREALKKVYPEFFTRQEEAIKEWHDIVKRLDSIAITGAKNKEDLFLAYRVGGRTKIGQKEGIHDYLMTRPGLTALDAQQSQERLTRTAAAFRRGLLGSDRRYDLMKALHGGGIARIATVDFMGDAHFGEHNTEDRSATHMAAGATFIPEWDGATAPPNIRRPATNSISGYTFYP